MFFPCLSFLISWLLTTSYLGIAEVCIYSVSMDGDPPVCNALGLTTKKTNRL